MHAIRDCEVVAEVWNMLVGEEGWSKFFSLGFSQWIEANLKNEEFGMGQWNWQTTFGMTMNLLWQNRNKKVFSDSPLNLDQLLFNIGNRVD